MESLYDRTTEDSIAALAAAGFIIDLNVSGFGASARFKVRITKGACFLGGTGFEIAADGEGSEGAAKLRGAVAVAETFLYAVEPRLPVVEVRAAGELKNASEGDNGASQPFAQAAE